MENYAILETSLDQSYAGWGQTIEIWVDNYSANIKDYTTAQQFSLSKEKYNTLIKFGVKDFLPKYL